MTNDLFWLNRLHEHPDLLPIAMEWQEALISELGYLGESAYVMFWEELDTNTLRWFDGALGSAGDLQAWWRWRHHRPVRVALRGIELRADFTENSFALLFDRCAQRFYVGRIQKVRALLEQLIEEQGLHQKTKELFDRLMLDMNHPEEFSEQQVMRLLESIDQGGVRPDPSKMH